MLQPPRIIPGHSPPVPLIGLCLLLLGACTTVAAIAPPAPSGSMASSPDFGNGTRPFFTPGPGKSEDDFENDRIACAYAVKPWTVQGVTDCMVTRGNTVRMVAATPNGVSPSGAAIRADADAARAASALATMPRPSA